MVTKLPGIASPDGSQYVTMTDGAGNLVSASTPLTAVGGVSLNTTALGTSQFLDVSLPDAGNNSLGWGGPFSVGSAVNLFSVDTSGYSSIVVQVIAINGSTITYEHSNDNTTWVVASGITSAGGSGQTLTTTSGNTGNQGVVIFPCILRYFRARVSNYVGVTTVYYSLRQNWTPTQVPISAGPGAVVALSPSNAKGVNYTHIAAGQATTVIKNSPGILYSITLNTQAAASNTTIFYDNASTSSALIIATIPAVTAAAGSTFQYGGAYGIATTLGLTVITATANGGDMTVGWT